MTYTLTMSAKEFEDLLNDRARLTAENERLREAASIGLEWMRDLEHMGSIVDQAQLSEGLAKVTAALGWVRVDQQQLTKGD